MSFRLLHFIALGVRINLFLNLFDFFQLQINDIIHDTLCTSHVFFEQIKIEV